jgi:hypothetical protein
MEKEDVNRLLDIATKSRVHGALIGVLLSEIHNIKEHHPHGDIEAWVLSRILKGDELDLEFGKYINLDN